jgi:hypothetical protein
MPSFCPFAVLFGPLLHLLYYSKFYQNKTSLSKMNSYSSKHKPIVTQDYHWAGCWVTRAYCCCYCLRLYLSLGVYCTYCHCVGSVVLHVRRVAYSLPRPPPLSWVVVPPPLPTSPPALQSIKIFLLPYKLLTNTIPSYCALTFCLPCCQRIELECAPDISTETMLRDLTSWPPLSWTSPHPPPPAMGSPKSTHIFPMFFIYLCIAM